MKYIKVMFQRNLSCILFGNLFVIALQLFRVFLLCLEWTIAVEQDLFNRKAFCKMFQSCCNMFFSVTIFNNAPSRFQKSLPIITSLFLTARSLVALWFWKSNTKNYFSGTCCYLIAVTSNEIHLYSLKVNIFNENKYYFLFVGFKT